MAESLHQLAVLMDFVKLLIWTGQLSDERPVSAIIVAPPGSGKTTTLESLQCEQCEFVGDLTARPLSGIVKSKESLTHILLGDMLSLFGHKETTVKLTLRLVSQMTGEKIMHDPWSGEAIKPRMLGLITAIPPEDLAKRAIEKHIKSGGFASRFLIARYSYKKATIRDIHKFISENRYSSITQDSFVMKNPGKQEVKIPASIAILIKEFGISIKEDDLGFRVHRHLRSLVKAQARRNARTVCTEDDFKIVEAYCDFFTGEKEI